MKMKLLKLLTLPLIASASFMACDEQDVPTAEGTLLDFEVPDTPPAVDHVVGANYARFDWSPNLYEEPSIGQYDALAGDVDAYNQHVAMADQAGIDFFIFQLRSAVEPASFTQDSTFVATLLGASAAGNQSFALSYDFAAMDLSGTNRIDVETEADLLDQMIADFIAMGDFFSQPNYQLASGNQLVYVSNADLLFAEDYASVFEEIRTAVNSAVGVSLYLIAEQQAWTPPMRFEFKFKDGVDAVTHSTFAQISAQSNAYDYDRFIQFEQYVDLALGFASEELTKASLDYIPQISPSYDADVQNPANNFFQIEKSEEWFRTFCDIAKRASGNNANNIIIVDSFNDWNLNTQLESAESYGNQFLGILRNEFKMN